MTTPHQNPDEAAIRGLLQSARRIAVVGLSPRPERDSNRIAVYLIERGYDVVPVYPREDEILGRHAYLRVQDIPGGVDLVDVFRRGQGVFGIAVGPVQAEMEGEIHRLFSEEPAAPAIATAAREA